MKATHPQYLGFLLVFLSHFVMMVSGQNISFNHINTKNGLSQISVNCMYVDSVGRVWAGTRDGLNCYNGVNCKIYRSRPNDPNSLTSNTIRRVIGDGGYKLFIVSIGELVSLDMRNDSIQKLVQGEVTSIYYSDRLYVALKNEIYQYNSESGNLDFYFRIPVENDFITSLYVDSKKGVFAGTREHGLFYIDSKRKIVPIIPDARIVHLYKDSKEDLWVSTWSSGLFCLQHSGEILRYKTDNSNEQLQLETEDKRFLKRNSISSNAVRVCQEDNEGQLWIGTFNGLNMLDRERKHFIYYPSNNDEHGLSHSSIWTMIKDLQGNIWIGTYFGGINYFTPNENIYTHFEISNSMKNGLSSNIVGRIVADNHHNLWIATEGGGLNYYNHKTNEFTWYKHNPKKNSLSHNNVKALYLEPNNNTLWIGTHTGGLCKMDIKTKHISVYKEIQDDSTSIPSNIIRDILPYKQKIILATSNGLALFDPITAKCNRSLSKSGLLFPDGEISDLEYDEKGRLWFTVVGQGVYCYSFSEDHLLNYRHSNVINSLTNNDIYKIYLDANNCLWFAPSGGGLDKYSAEKDAFIHYDNKKKSLGNRTIYEICTAGDNRLILTTNQGFMIFDYETGEIERYTSDNGFPLRTINENSLFVTADQSIYVGGMEGMLAFKLNELNKSMHEPYYLLFSNVQVDGKEIPLVTNKQKIEIEPSQRMIDIQIAATNFNFSNKDAIYYRLKGFSDEWYLLSSDKKIVFTNLDAGKYTLDVRSLNKNSKCVPLQLAIKVLKPLYARWWAILVYLCLAMGIAYMLVKEYNARIKLRHSLILEQKERQYTIQMNQSKLRFFTNISHEFRTPLTLISGQIESLLHGKILDPDIYKKILSAYHSSKQLNELITELLDFRKQEQGMMKLHVANSDFVSFVRENCLLFSEFLKEKGISLFVKTSFDTLDVLFDEKQLQKVINNLLSNAVKHTQKDEKIIVNLDSDGEIMTLSVTNTGIGLSQQQLKQIFSRFYQVENNQMMEIGGTGIGLALSKGIIELHHGKIYAESDGSTYVKLVVELPVNSSLFTTEEKAERKWSGNGLAVSDASSIKKLSLLSENTRMKHLTNWRSDDGEISDIVLSNKENSVENLNSENGKPLILIVEDNIQIRQFLSTLFEPMYTVYEAEDGQNAWEFLSSESLLPDIVLSDIMMPNMSGVELCKRIKHDFDMCHIPVVLLTARTAVEHNLEGLNMGADDYITKPFDSRILLTRCNNLVNIRTLLKERFNNEPDVKPYVLATNQIDKEFISKIENIINKYIADNLLSVNLLAKEVGVARTSLFTKLKNITGQTPNEFIVTIRLKRSAKLLTHNPEMNITEVSEMVGFSSPQYFSKCFKKVYNLSPYSYRKQCSN